MRNVFGALAFTLMAFGSPAAAQQTGSTDAETGRIVVEGKRDRERQIKQFIDALTPAPFGGQLSRFEWSACPVAMGLSEPRNVAVAARMRRVAEAAGIPTGKVDCRPNVFVIVTDDKQVFIERLRREFPVYFTDVGSRDVRRLAHSPGPVAAWHVKGRLNADGLEVPRDAVTGYYVSEVTDIPSRITASTRPHFLASIVVAELDALAGLTTTQFADYAAMRAFAQTDPSRLTNVAAPTILTLLDAPMDSPIPITLTQWDLVFLRALYASGENRYAHQQRGEMRRRIGKDLERTQQEE